MKLLLVIFISLLHVSILAAALSQCKCPYFKHKNTRGLIAVPRYCGYEVIKKRTAAGQSVLHCKPNSVYLCRDGPNERAIEAPCDLGPAGNGTCIPGSEAFAKITTRSPESNAFNDASDPRNRVCASLTGNFLRPLKAALPN